MRFLIFSSSKFTFAFLRFPKTFMFGLTSVNTIQNPSCWLKWAVLILLLYFVAVRNPEQTQSLRACDEHAGKSQRTWRSRVVWQSQQLLTDLCANWVTNEIKKKINNNETSFFPVNSLYISCDGKRMVKTLY